MLRGLRDEAEGFACLRPKMVDFLSTEEVAKLTINKDGEKCLETHFSMICTVQKSRQTLGGKIVKNLGYNDKYS